MVTLEGPHSTVNCKILSSFNSTNVHGSFPLYQNRLGIISKTMKLSYLSPRLQQSIYRTSKSKEQNTNVADSISLLSSTIQGNRKKQAWKRFKMSLASQSTGKQLCCILFIVLKQDSQIISLNIIKKTEFLLFLFSLSANLHIFSWSSQQNGK